MYYIYKNASSMKHYQKYIFFIASTNVPQIKKPTQGISQSILMDFLCTQHVNYVPLSMVICITQTNF